MTNIPLQILDRNKFKVNRADKRHTQIEIKAKPGTFDKPQPTPPPLMTWVSLKIITVANQNVSNH